MESDRRILPGAEIPHEVFYITPTPIALDGMFFQVNRAGITSRTPPTFSICRKSAHVFNVIHCVTGGRGSVTVRGETFPIAGGDAFLLPAYESHTYQSDPEDPLGLTWVEFAGSNSAQLSKHILDLKGPVQSGPVCAELLRLCQQLLACVHNRDLQSSQLLYQMLIALCDSHSVVSDEQMQKKQEILNYIDAHLDQDISVSTVAQYFGYHPNYFSNLFSKMTGEPFSQHLIYRRVSRACQLLMTTDLPIQTISSALGFFDVSHLHRHFKRICGVTPAQYRRENRGLIHSGDDTAV